MSECSQGRQSLPFAVHNTGDRSTRNRPHNGCPHVSTLCLTRHDQISQDWRWEWTGNEATFPLYNVGGYQGVIELALCTVPRLCPAMSGEPAYTRNLDDTMTDSHKFSPWIKHTATLDRAHAHWVTVEE